MMSIKNLANNDSMTEALHAPGVTLDWLKGVLDDAGYTTEISGRGLVAKHPSKYTMVVSIKDFLKVVVTDVMLRIHRKPEGADEKAFLTALNRFNFNTDFLSVASSDAMDTLYITSHMSIGDTVSAAGFLHHVEILNGLISNNIPNDPLGAFLK